MDFEGLRSFYDSRDFDPDQVFECDICIIGSGPAGISMAREFANSDKRVILLESGGLWLEEDIEELNRLVVTGHNYPETGSRLRLFGGTANHWGGHCAPMTPIGLGKRDWIEYSGWPFGIDELNPYYERAHEVIEIGPYDYRSRPTAVRLGLDLLPFDPRFVKSQLSRYHAQNFGPRYAEELDAAPNISVFLYATVTSINLDEHKRFVSDVDVKTLAGNGFQVKAKTFVLAAGGIENARLLLLSDRDMRDGLGNQNDLVGRFFMDHVAYDNGLILPFDQNLDAVKYYAQENYLEDDYDVRAHLILSDASVEELRIPEYRVELQAGFSRKYFSSVRSSARLRRFLMSFDADFVSLEDVVTILSDLGSPIKYLAGDLGAPFVYGFLNHVEQVPNPDSRVMLSDKRDALGQRKVALHWQLRDIDILGMSKAQRLIAREVGRAEIGRMQVNLPETIESIPPTVRAVEHHMGTTRMNPDPKWGVVDSNCRIHGVENIYVAGSSVFPTGGYPNPTLTLTALAIRLADHIKQTL